MEPSESDSEVDDVKMPEAEAQVASKVSTQETVRSIAVLMNCFIFERASAGRAWCLLITMFSLECAGALVGIRLSYCFGSIADAVKDLHEQVFWDQVWALVAFSSLMIFIAVGTHICQTCFGFEWRRCITAKILLNYIDHRKLYYHLKQQNKELDNPDARIAQDVQDFCASCALSFHRISKGSFVAVSTSFTLWSLDRTLTTVGLIAAAFSTLIIFVGFGGPLIRRQREVLRQEADMRSSLIHIRSHAESIAFLGGEACERTFCLSYLSAALHAQYRRLWAVVAFETFKGCLDKTMHLFPLLILAHNVFMGKLSFGKLSQGQHLFSSFYGGLECFIQELKQLCELGAHAIRIQQLFDKVDSVPRSHRKDWISDDFLEHTCKDMILKGLIKVQLINQPDLLLRVSNLCIFTPTTSSILLENLSFSLKPVESMLVTGESGTGKTSLLRALAGIWKNGAGTIERCNLRGCVFLPQEPYVCKGSLRSNLVYPMDLSSTDTRDEFQDTELKQALLTSGLNNIIQKHSLDEEFDFDEMLSGIEKQRLSFARLQLWSDVQLVILDQATSAMDEIEEMNTYIRLRCKTLTYISVGHRKSLEAYHTRKLLSDRSSSRTFDMTHISQTS